MFSSMTIRSIFKNRPYLSTYTISALLHACYMLRQSHRRVTRIKQSRNFAAVRDMSTLCEVSGWVLHVNEVTRSLSATQLCKVGEQCPTFPWQCCSLLRNDPVPVLISPKLFKFLSLTSLVFHG